MRNVRVGSRLLGRVLVALALVAGVATATPGPASSSPGATLPEGYTETTVVTGLSSPTKVTFAPGGRILISEKAGRVMLFTADGQAGWVFLDLSAVTQTNGSRGLMGVAFDPAFAVTRHVFVFYASLETGENRVSRFTVDAEADPFQADIASEVVLLEIDGVPGWHNAGELRFGPDGMLYISTGDGHPKLSGHDPESVENLNGKILRVDVSGCDATHCDDIIPADNPYVGEPNARPEIFARGLRNPFSFDIDPVDGRIFADDVGPDEEDEPDSGARWEEVNEISAGANYGWDTCNGVCAEPGTTDPIHAYPHSEFPSERASIVGAAFYRASQFPFVGDFFFGDFVEGFIHRLTTTGAVEVFATGLAPYALVDLVIGPQDGSLYYLLISATSDQANDDGVLVRVDYADGEDDREPPVVTITSPEHGSRGGAPEELAGTATDNVGVGRVFAVVFEWANQQWLRADGTLGVEEQLPAVLTNGDWIIDLPDNMPSGDYLARVVAVDGAGNPSDPLAKARFIADLVPPDATITAPAHRSTGPRPLVLTGSVIDDVSVRRVHAVVRHDASGNWLRFDGSLGEKERFVAAITGDTWSIDVPGSMPAGDYTTYVVAKDTAGNKTSPNPRSRFTVEPG